MYPTVLTFFSTSFPALNEMEFADTMGTAVIKVITPLSGCEALGWICIHDDVNAYLAFFMRSADNLITATCFIRSKLVVNKRFLEAFSVCTRVRKERATLAETRQVKITVC